MNIVLVRDQCQLQTPFLDVIREELSVFDPSTKYAKTTNKFATGRLYMISKTGTFKTGLLWYIVSKIRNMDINDPINISPEVLEVCKPTFDFHDKPLCELVFTPHDYQAESVRRMLKFGRGVLNIGTGGGKTYTFAIYLATLKQYGVKLKTLIVVPTIGLVNQTYADLLDYGFTTNEVSKWSGTNPRQDTDIIIAFSNFTVKHRNDVVFFKSIKQLIVDECHILKKSNGINKVMHIIDTPTRFGFTGTTPEEEWDNWNMMGQTGPIIYKKNSKSLRDGGYISNLFINVLRVNYNTFNISRYRTILANVEDKKLQYIAETDFIVNNTFRNNLIYKVASETTNNTLILVDRIAHGDIIKEGIESLGLDRTVYWISGKTKAAFREEIRQLMEQHDDIICIAMTKVFSVGINVKNLHNIIFASAGKAKVKIVQTLGRGLRKHPRKDILNVYDVADILKYGVSHFKARSKLYKDESIEYKVNDIVEQ